MMRRILVWTVLLCTLVTTFNSCDNKEPEPIPLIVGTWTRDIYEFTDLPAGFQNFDGYKDESLFNDDSYTLTFSADNTYTRKIVFTGPDQNDTGTWTLESDDLKLDSNDTDIDDEDFKVAEEITANQMIISQVITFGLPPDAVTDTVTNAWINAHPEEWQSYFQPVDVTVLFLFEK